MVRGSMFNVRGSWFPCSRYGVSRSWFGVQGFRGSVFCFCGYWGFTLGIRGFAFGDRSFWGSRCSGFRVCIFGVRGFRVSGFRGIAVRCFALGIRGFHG